MTSSSTTSGSIVSMPLVWQQIVALDAKYNQHRNFENCKSVNFRILYIKRRNQLLRESVRKDAESVTSFRRQYLKIRSQLLSTRHGQSFDTARKYSRSSNPWTPECDPERKAAVSLRDAPKSIILDGNSSGDQSSLVELNCNSSPDFCGMHHVFDQHKSAVTAVRFAFNDKSLLASSSMDGTLSICQITPPPATVLYIMRGHDAGVRDFQWSVSNDFLVSCSLDCTVRLWDTASGVCLRIIRDPTESPVLACSYQPSNNNMVVIGNEKGYVHVLNVSTGIPVKGGSLRTSTNCSIQCLVFDSNGRTMWVGDDKGFIYSFSFDMTTGRLSRLTRTLIHPGSSITCLSTRSLVRHQLRTLFLLVNCSPNMLLLFEVRPDKQIVARNRFNIKHQNRCLMVRSSFCPLMSLKETVCVTSGSEDGSIYFFRSHDYKGGGAEASNLESARKCISSLQGHAAAVVDVCLNFDESLLASSDEIGNVIVWKKTSLSA